MIVGKISEIDKYGIYSEAIKKGIAFLKQLSPDTPAGTYDIDKGIYANVMEYQTHIQEDFLYEAHRKHLDIHYVLKGGEKIKWSSIVGLAEATPYNTEKDAIFYKGDVCKSEITLNNELFAIMFPYDGHSCQHVDEIANVEIRKVVVKISI